MNLFAGQEERHRHRTDMWTWWGGGWDELGDWSWHIYTTIHKRESRGKLLCRTGAQLGALWSPKWVGLGWGLGGRSKREVYKCTYSWFTLLYSRNYTPIKKTLILFLKPFFKTPAHIIFYHSLYYRESACNVGDLGLIPGLGRSPGGGYGNPHQDSCLENPYGERSPAGYSPQGCKESDTTEWLSTQHIICRTHSNLFL